MLVPLTGTEPKPSALEVQSLNHWTWEVPAMQFLGCMFNRFSRVRLFVTLWTVAHQDPLSMGFPRQEYWSGVPCPPPGDLPNPGIEPVSIMSPALAGGSLPQAPARQPNHLLR